jgi:hypothetical protein
MQFLGARLGSDPPDAGRPSADAEVAALVVFVGGVLPCTAPFALLVAIGWLALGRRGLRSLTPIRRTMFGLGCVAAGATTCVVLAILFFRQLG